MIPDDSYAMEGSQDRGFGKTLRARSGGQQWNGSRFRPRAEGRPPKSDFSKHLGASACPNSSSHLPFMG